MVQVLQAPQINKRSFLDKLSTGVATAGQIGQQLMQQHEMKQEQQQQYHQENAAVKQLIGKDISGIRDTKIRQDFVNMALQGQNQKEKFNQEMDFDKESYSTIESTFGKKFADIWKAAPVGARTELVKRGIESIRRGDNLENLLKNVQPSTQNEEENIDQDENQQNQTLESPEEARKPVKKPLSKEKQVEKELNDYLKKQDEGLLPSEKIARGKERFDTGLKQYQAAGEKLRGMTRDKERLDVLEELDKGDKLPKNLGRLNVDNEGNLRLPFLASAEAQRFVKTLNEFSQGAKDTFGSRVTNFDLAQFLKRFPNLLNSKEGRRQIMQQMKIVNQINSTYYKNLKNIYDKAGGVRNIDADVAERFAEQLSDDKINELVGKFKEIGTFESQPNAKEFKGRKIRDKDTGEVFVSDGENWVPEE